MSRDKESCEFIKEVKQISWGVEIVKTLVTSVFGSVFAIIFLYVIEMHSPGDYYGPRLENEFKNMLCKQISLEAEIQEFQYVYIGELSAIDDKKIVISTGIYYNGDETRDGRFVAIFAPKPYSLFNELLETTPAYKVDYLRLFPVGDGLARDTLCFDSLMVEDVNHDFYNEFILSFCSRYGDRSSTDTAFLSWTSDGWKCSALDISSLDLEKTIRKMSGIGYEVLYENYPLMTPKGTVTDDRIVGLAYNGLARGVTDPCWNIPCVLYMIPINDGRTGYMNTHEYVFLMAVYENGELRVSNNWNQGKPLLSRDVPEELQDDFDDFVDHYWGFQVGDSIFYGSP